MKSLALTILISSTLYASAAETAVYVPPSDTVFLKVDQIPLDVERMHELASTLLEVAASPRERTAEALQACAKLVAIAAQLDPKNEKIEPVNTTLLTLSPNPSDESNQSFNDAQLALTFHFLKQKEQGSEAKQLADRLNTSLHVLYPNNPHFKNDTTTSVSWENIVAPLAEFTVDPELDLINTQRVKHSEKAPQEELLSNSSTSGDEFIKKLDKVPNPPALKKWRIQTQNVQAPVTFLENKQAHHSVSKVMVSMIPISGGSANKITISSDSLSSLSSERSKLAEKLSKIFKQQWPKGFQSAELKIFYAKQVNKNFDFSVLTALSSIVLDASLLNRKLSPDLIVAMGQNDSGEFVRNTRFWDYLPSLTQLSDQHRILVTSDSEGDLQQLLVTTDAEFFIRHEIFAVNDLEDSRNYRTIELEGDIAKASELFATVQEVLEGKSIRSMASNTHVRSKLKEIYTLNPHHLSAKMLLILGSEMKPNTIATKYLGYEIQSILREVKPSISTGLSTIDQSNKIIAKGDILAERIRELNRHTSPEDREVFVMLKDLADTLQSAGKSHLKSLDYYSNRSEYHAKSYSDDMLQLKQIEADLTTKAKELIANDPPKKE
ncbi:hypothetical protein ACFPK9_09255 [Rubritalea spongiae]|uniref:Uncharacterized protein n=1 Tax=Rubritalea spongiae TaxID=430797 RepID=A0ABW5E2K6_9BACT